MRIGSVTTRSVFAKCRSDGPSPHRDRQLVGARQLLQMTKRELLEEERCRAVMQRTSEPLTAADDVDQPSLEQRFEHAADGHAADLLDLGAADRLAIGDDRKRLERSR